MRASDTRELQLNARWLLETWQRSEAESVLQRRSIADSDTGLKTKAIKESAPPQSITILDARLHVERELLRWSDELRARGLKHPRTVPGLLNALAEHGPGYLDVELLLELQGDLARLRRGLARAIDGWDDRIPITPCPTLDCEGTARAIPGLLGVECPACGRSWVGMRDIERLRDLVAA